MQLPQDFWEIILNLLILIYLNTVGWATEGHHPACKQAVGGRPPRYAPPLSSPMGAEVFSHGQHVPMPTTAAPDAPTWWWAKWPGDLDLLTLKVVFESRVMWATSMPILVFLGLSVLDLGPMYAPDRQTSDAHHRFNGHNKLGVGLFVVTIWLKLCTSYNCSCHLDLRHPCSNKIQNDSILVPA